MDYEKMYKEALERAKSFQEKYGGDYAGYIFPELAESEDERVRRTLVEYFGPKVQLDFVRGVPIQKIRDWLEKQKEHKSAERKTFDEWVEDYWSHNKVNNPHSYNKGDEIQFDHKGFVSFCEAYCYPQNLILHDTFGYEEGRQTGQNEGVKFVLNNPKKYGLQKPAEWSEDKFPKDIEKDASQFCFDNGINITPHQAKQIATHYLMVGHNEGYIEGRKNAHIPARELGLPSSCDFQKEQKPAWSEEDEEMRLEAIRVLVSGCERYRQESGRLPSWRGVIDWLKSLRPSWKPSEEQMDALAIVIDDYYHACTKGSDDKSKTLKTLFEQLKKL